MAQQLTVDGEAPSSLLSLCEEVARDAESTAELSLALTPNPEKHFVDIVATSASLELWARYRLWVDSTSMIQTRACMCTFAACDEVKRSCELPTPKGALPIDANPGPARSLSWDSAATR